MHVPVFSPRTYSRCVVSHSSPQSRRLLVGSRIAVVPEETTAPAIYCYRLLHHHRDFRTFSTTHALHKWVKCPFANTSSPLSSACSADTPSISSSDTCSRAAGNPRELSLPSPAAISPPRLPRALSPLITAFSLVETTGEGPDRFQTCPQQNSFTLFPGKRMGESGVKMQMCCNRQLRQKQVSMSNSPAGFSSSLIPFSMWSSGTFTLQARIVVSQGLGWIKYLTLQRLRNGFSFRDLQTSTCQFHSGQRQQNSDLPLWSLNSHLFLRFSGAHPTLKLFFHVGISMETKTKSRSQW